MRMPRKSSKKSNNRTQQDADFERLYRTIPANSSPAATDSDAPAAPFPPSRPEKPRWKKVLKRAIIIIVIILALSGLWLGWKFIANTVKIFGWSGLWDLLHTQKLDGEDEGRVNILLAGNSADDAGHAGAALTDSIMLVSINTKDKNGYILSIPRDLYVDMPDDSGYAKINEAYQDGERGSFRESGYADGGMGLLEKAVSQHFGTRIHYYALVNYAALQQAVNAVGGITIDIQSTDPRGLYDPSPDLKNNRQPLVRLPNGQVTLSGRDALNLARARGHARGAYGYGLGDFTRTEHQRKILIGLKEKGNSIGTLSNPVKMSKLLDAMGNNVQTDLKTGHLRRLYALTKDIPSSHIASVSLNNAKGKDLLESYRTRSGQSALVPAAGIDDYRDIQDFLAGL